MSVTSPFVFTLGCTPLGVFADKLRKNRKKLSPKDKPLRFCYLPSTQSPVKEALHGYKTTLRELGQWIILENAFSCSMAPGLTGRADIIKWKSIADAEESLHNNFDNRHREIQANIRTNSSRAAP